MLGQVVGLPSIYRINGYSLYFWSNEGIGLSIEPVHLHASKQPSKKNTKFWLTSDGNVLVGDNGAKIPRKDILDIVSFIRLNYGDIINKWC